MLESDIFAKFKAEQDPVQWVRHSFGIVLDPAQAVALTTIDEDGARVLIEACNGSGKTFLAAMAVVRHMVKYGHPARVITTSGGERQVNTQMWAEIRKYAAMLNRTDWRILQDSPAIKTDNPDTFAMGYSAEDPGKAEGWHSDNMLIVVDEAKSIKQKMWDAIHSTLTNPKNKLLIITVPGDPDVLPHTLSANPDYRHIRIAPEITEGMQPEAPNLYYCQRVNEKWYREMLSTYGPDSAVFRRRVLAQSVHVAESPYFSEDLIKKMFVNYKPWTQADRGMRPKRGLAVDWGRRIDYTVVTEWLGHHGRLLERTQRDYMEVIGKLLVMHQADPYDFIIVDEGEGRGQIDRMRELGLPVEGFNFGSTIDKAPAKLLIMSHLHTAMEVGDIGFLTDAEAFNEFMSFEYTVTSEGRMKLEASAGMHDDIVCSAAMGFWRSTRVGHQGKPAAAVRTQPPPGMRIQDLYQRGKETSQWDKWGRA